MACDVLPVAMFFWLCTFSSMRCCIASTMNNGSLKVECLNIESLVARQMVRMTRTLGVASIRDNGRYLCLACQPSTNPFSDVPDKTEFPNVLFFQRTPSLNKKNEKSCGPIGLLGYLSSVDDAHDPWETNWARFLCYCSPCQVADLFPISIHSLSIHETFKKQKRCQ